MAARAADSAFAFPGFPASPADREHPAVKPSQMQEDKLGAFRGLGFAILFQTSLGALALAA
jgi:hypothetical protein